MVHLKNYTRIIGIFIFIYILSRLEWQEMLILLGKVKILYFWVSIFLIIPIVFLRTLKWRLLINSLEITVPFRPLTEMMMKGLFLGFFTPGKVGEFYRAKYLSKLSNTTLATTLFTVIFDRVIDFLIFGVIALIGGIIFAGLFKTPLVLIVFSFLLVILIFSLLIKKEYLQKILRFLIRYFLPKTVRNKTNSFVENFFNQIKKMNKMLMMKLFFVESLYYLTLVIIHYFLSLSLRLYIPFWYLFIIIALVTLLVILPFSFSGLGTREAGYIFFLSFLGISPTQAVSFSLLIFVWNILLTIPGGALLLKNKNL
ncbi:MAG: lysylphosphatidylglycerol synthase transmembrane domain-containing protein [Candidatus Aminicenantia bacterium]